jgi:tetratricopeptide (TPR) repeat protein
MEAITNKGETQTRRRLALWATGIPVLLSVFIVLGVTAGKRVLRSADENLRARDSSVQAASCRLVLTPLPGDKPVDEEIARQQALVLAGSQAALERLGWTFVKKARLSFDAGFYKLAEQCAACLETQGSKGPDTLLLRAHVLHSLHHFADAEAAARELIRLRQRPFDYGVLGDILIDQGKVREGAAAYQTMVDLRPDLQSYARAAYVRWLTGDLKGAIELMQLATTATSPNDPEAGAWAFTRLALYQQQRGATKQALQTCDTALSLQSDYAPAMLARGRSLLALNRSADALVEFERAAKLNSLPDYQWALADVLRLAGQDDRAAEVDSQIAARATEDPRTLSLYLATRHTDIERAVKLAQQELANRGDVFTHDALAWALAAAGRTTEAQQHIDKALSQRTSDPRLYLHAGVIAALNNDHKQARRWLDQAAAMQQMLFPSEQAQLDAWRQGAGRKTPRTH